MEGLHQRLRSLHQNVDLLSRLVTNLVPGDIKDEVDPTPVRRAKVICISSGVRSH